MESQTGSVSLSLFVGVRDGLQVYRTIAGIRRCIGRLWVVWYDRVDGRPGAGLQSMVSGSLYF